jgi:hypothetical protein
MRMLTYLISRGGKNLYRSVAPYSRKRVAKEKENAIWEMNREGVGAKGIHGLQYRRGGRRPRSQSEFRGAERPGPRLRPLPGDYQYEVR